MSDDGIDFRDYTSEYLAEHEEKSISFESILSNIRKGVVLKQIDASDETVVLEVGCGLDPLFVDLPSFQQCIVVEPSTEFVKKAGNRVSQDDNVTIIEGRLEEVTDELPTGIDYIVLSSVLHEVPNPNELLNAVYEVASPETSVHINVPNVYSLHRLLAAEMGLIESVYEKSETEKQFQRYSHYDRQRLVETVQSAGFEVREFSTYFLKPFSNAQMEMILEQEIVDESVVNGLKRVADHFPEHGAEMYVTVRQVEESD